MKVTLITVVLNCEKYISCCINSVLQQDYKNIEYLIIDGKSTDGTLAIIESHRSKITRIVSEKDTGFYGALNRGIRLATGQIIGVLNADDFLAHGQVISTIVNNFNTHSCDAVYGNLDYINRYNQEQVVRRWRSAPFNRSAVKYGWMPPHPTVYFRREVYQKFGCYSESFGYCSDYELILRMFYKNEVNSVFIDMLIVKMRMGGMSNNSLRGMIRGCFNDYKAVKLHQIPNPLVTILVKKLRKFEQLL